MTTDKETIAALTALLVESQRLGLTFHVGSAYITRGYITQQTDLNDRIAIALDRPA